MVGLGSREVAVDWRQWPPEAVRSGWSPRLEDIFDEVYGDDPRRLGYHTALAATGEAMTVPILVASNMNLPATLAGGLPFTHVYEPPEDAPGVSTDATAITERTMLSEPHRALLECAQFPERVPCMHNHLATFVTIPEWDSPIDPLRVEAAAQAWGWQDALRRIASVAAGLATCPELEDFGWPPPAWAELAQGVDADAAWIDLNFHRPGYTGRIVPFIDPIRRVRWPYDIGAVADFLLN